MSRDLDLSLLLTRPHPEADAEEMQVFLNKKRGPRKPTAEFWACCSTCWTVYVLAALSKEGEELMRVVRCPGCEKHETHVPTAHSYMEWV